MAEKPTEDDIGELADLISMVRMGLPRAYIERYFMIAPEGGKPALVPMLFENEPNQEYYYQQLFERIEWEAKHPGLQWEAWKVDALCLKDRKARWTAFVAAVLTAKMFCVPGTHVLGVVNAEDTFPVIHQFMDGFYRNMPEWARPKVAGNAWGLESKTIVFDLPNGGRLTSSFVVRTAATANVGSGVTPTDVWFDEYPKFPETFSREAQASLRASMSARASFWRGGTVGPAGMGCIAYEEIQQYKKGLLQVDYLFRTWFQNPGNHLLPGSRLRRPADQEDGRIVAGVGGGPNCEKEPMLVRQFPDDGVPWQWRVARRRAWMREAALAAGEQADSDGTSDVANILFQREHCEDDETPWSVAGFSQFKMSFLDAQMAIAQAPENLLIISEPLQGLSYRSWRPYDPSHVYCLGGDLGSGSGGDDSSFQLCDVTSMTFIGELHGNVTDPYNAVTAAVKVMRQWGNPVFVLENNRFPGIADYVKNTLGYENVWKPPMRAGESAEAWVHRHAGMNVTATHHSDQEPSAESLNAMFKGDFNNGAFRIVNPLLLKTMRGWDPNRDRHTPDRIAGARLVRLGLAEARERAPVTGAVGNLWTRAQHVIMAAGRAGGPPTPFRGW